MSKSYCEYCDDWTKPDGPYSDCPICADRLGPAWTYVIRNECGQYLYWKSGEIEEVLKVKEATRFQTEGGAYAAICEWPLNEYEGWLEIVKMQRSVPNQDL